METILHRMVIAWWLSVTFADHIARQIDRNANYEKYFSMLVSPCVRATHCVRHRSADAGGTVARPQPTVRRRRLGLELRRIREERKLTLEQAAKLLERVPSAISKIENGKQALPARDVPFILDKYEVLDTEVREHLAQLARRGTQRNWWQDYRDVVRDPLADFLNLEEDAKELGVFDGLRIPGLLQTEEYATAVVEASRAWRTAEEMRRFVELRMARQNVLRRPEPLQLWAVMTEQVLIQRVGGVEAMRRQLAHLLDVSHSHPSITIQILPPAAGAHGGMDGPFSIMRFGGLDADIAVVESLTATLYLEEDNELDRYRTAWEHVKSAALSPMDSRAAIKRIIKELG
ncbi:Scr1 family TA system antitoxin-like transcriptional regulator [Streptodolium elevatio]